MKPETVINFDHDGDIAPIVKAWASEEGYKEKNRNDGYVTYKKGTGFLVAPMFFAFRQNGRKVEAKAWIYANFIARLGSLFILPKFMHVDSGGFRGVVPRKMGRAAVNRLLERLKQAPIP